MTRWKPTETPWRVRKIYVGQNLPGGWADSVQTFATKAEAMASLAAGMARGQSETSVEFAKNAKDWNDRGRWVLVATRKSGKRRSLARISLADQAEMNLADRRADKRARTCSCGFVGKTHGGLSIHQNTCGRRNPSG